MTLINSLFAKIMPILPRWSVKPFAKPYVAGEKIQDVTNVVKNLNHKGFSATIDILGEFVESKDEATEVRNQYEKLINLGEASFISPIIFNGHIIFYTEDAELIVYR